MSELSCLHGSKRYVACDDVSEATPLGSGRDNKNDIRVKRRKDNRRDLHSICCLLHSCTYRAAYFLTKEVKKMRKTELKELYKMMFPDYPDIITVAQLQEMLGVSRHLAYDLINNGYISGVKIGNAFKIPKVNVINYVMEEGVKNAS